MKKNSTLLRELRAELHYWQMRTRMAAKDLKSLRKKVKGIGAQMRELQKDGKQ